MEKIEEVWSPIPDYEGHYEISNLCRVKSLKLKNTEIILKEWINKKGYKYVNLSKSGKSKIFGVHILMAITFMNYTTGNRKIIIDHKDNIRRFDNTISNLQIITQRVNQSKDRENKTSKFIGVCWNKKAEKWKSGIDIDGKKKHLGYFTDESEASEYYQNALISIKKNEEIKVKKSVRIYNAIGVCFHKRINKWQAYIVIDNKQKHLGYFNKEHEAHNARKNALVKTRQLN